MLCHPSVSLSIIIRAHGSWMEIIFATEYCMIQFDPLTKEESNLAHTSLYNLGHS